MLSLLTSIFNTLSNRRLAKKLHEQVCSEILGIVRQYPGITGKQIQENMAISSSWCEVRAFTQALGVQGKLILMRKGGPTDPYPEMRLYHHDYNPLADSFAAMGGR